MARARLALDTANRELALADERLAKATTLDERRDALTQREAATLTQLQARRALIQAPLEAEQHQLELLKSQQAARLTLAGLNDNAVATAREGVRQAQAELDLARERVRLAQTPLQRQDAQSGVLTAQAALLQARQQLTLAPLDAEQRLLNLLKAQVSERLQLAGLADNGVAVAASNIELAQRELALAERRLSAASTQTQQEEAQIGVATARTALSQAEDQISKARLDREASLLGLLKAQGDARLELAGLADNGVARAELGLQTAQRELALAQERVSLARTETELIAARTGLASAAVAASQAERALVQARTEADQKAFDLLEAQVRGRAQITRMADDAVASAQIDLDVTKGKLGLVDRQLASAQSSRLTQEQISALLKDQVTLQGQAVQQEDKLLDAQRARVTLLEGLSLAQRGLGNELQGGTPEARGTREALNGVTEARLKLTQAERAYGDAQADLNRSQSSSNLEKYRTATEGLTSAIAGQRSAVGALASQYATLLSNQDNVRSASENLKKVLYGDAGQPFDDNKELDRFSAIQTRRDAALRAAQVALKSGDAAQIAQTSDELAKQEDRYRQQADLLKKNGPANLQDE